MPHHHHRKFGSEKNIILWLKQKKDLQLPILKRNLRFRIYPFMYKRVVKWWLEIWYLSKLKSPENAFNGAIKEYIFKFPWSLLAHTGSYDRIVFHAFEVDFYGPQITLKFFFPLSFFFGYKKIILNWVTLQYKKINLLTMFNDLNGLSVFRDWCNKNIA